MAATIKFIKPEHKEIIQEYISENEGVILVMPHMQDKFTEKGINDEEYLDEYDFGGDADHWVDVVSNDSHHVFDNLNNEE